MADYEKKVAKSFSIYPSQIDWLEKRAEQETHELRRKISASEVLTRLIKLAQVDDGETEKSSKRAMLKS